MPLTFARNPENPLPLHVLGPDTLDRWITDQASNVATWVKASGFGGGIGETLLISDGNGAPKMALASNMILMVAILLWRPNGLKPAV